jgi:hypothetical protein
MALLSKSGFGQVEPNHLSSQRTGQIYAQLPVEQAALASIVTPGIIQNGMFLDYDYAKQSVVAPLKPGGSALTMLVMNEIRTYADFLTPKDYAQIANGTTAGIGLSNEAPANFGSVTIESIGRATGGVVTFKVTSPSIVSTGSVVSFSSLAGTFAALNKTYTVVTSGGLTSTALDLVETFINATTTATARVLVYGAGGTASFNTVYPRLFKIEAGDIITTNLVSSPNGAISDFIVGDTLCPGTDGVLALISASTTGSQKLVFRVAAISTTPDLQVGLKLQCVSN